MWILLGTTRFNKAAIEWLRPDEQDNTYLLMRVAGREYRVSRGSSAAVTATITEIIGSDTIVSLND